MEHVSTDQHSIGGDLARRGWTDLVPAGAALGLSAWRALNRWTIEWVEDNNRRIAYNIHDCFYRHVLTDYGVPDLTSHFCQLDDVLSAGLALSQA